jgi:zinc transport system substrate-binding protein
VVVTIKPIHSLAAALMEGIGEPHLLIEGTASPHSYALKPSEVRELHAARVVVMVSDGLETFMGKVARSLPKSAKLVRLDRAPGITLLPVREGGLFEAHAHEGKGGQAHGHGHDHGKKAKSAAKAAPGMADGHIWLDPVNAKAIVAELARVLGEVAPEHKARLAANAGAATARIDALQAEIARDLEVVRGKPFIVFHDAYQYFESRFGLAAAGSITVNPEVQPGARRLKELRERLEKAGAVCVFAEPQFEPKIVRTLTEGTKVRIGTLDPIGAAIPAGPDAYGQLLKGLAADLKGCLAAGA